MNIFSTIWDYFTATTPYIPYVNPNDWYPPINMPTTPWGAPWADAPEPPFKPEWPEQMRPRQFNSPAERKAYLEKTYKFIRAVEHQVELDTIHQQRTMYFRHGRYFPNKQWADNYYRYFERPWYDKSKMKIFWRDMAPLKWSKDYLTSWEAWRDAVVNVYGGDWTPIEFDPTIRQMINNKVNPRTYYFTREARYRGLDEETIYIKLLDGDFFNEGMITWAPALAICGAFLWVAWDIAEFDEEGSLPGEV